MKEQFTISFTKTSTITTNKRQLFYGRTIYQFFPILAQTQITRYNFLSMEGQFTISFTKTSPITDYDNFFLWKDNLQKFYPIPTQSQT